MTDPAKTTEPPFALMLAALVATAEMPESDRERIIDALERGDMTPDLQRELTDLCDRELGKRNEEHRRLEEELGECRAGLIEEEKTVATQVACLSRAFEDERVLTAAETDAENIDAVRATLKGAA